MSSFIKSKYALIVSKINIILLTTFENVFCYCFLLECLDYFVTDLNNKRRKKYTYAVNDIL